MAPCEDKWLSSNSALVYRADKVIAEQLADSKQFCEHSSAKMCDEVFGILQRSLGGAENGSLLLLGEAGSGKTTLLEGCVEKLRTVNGDLTVLRAQGGEYASDWDCVRHLVTQATGQEVAAPKGNSFEQGLEWIRSVLAAAFRRSSAVLVVLERFEHFCSKARQTLLYNLFDLAQEVGVSLCIVGTSEKMDVMEALEKRIKSRFSMRHLHTFLPTAMKELINVLMCKLRLPHNRELNETFAESFRSEFRRRLEAALWARAPDWKRPLELGRPVTWFLSQCLPLAGLLQAATGASEPAAKRARTIAQGPGWVAPRTPLLAGLAEVEHIVMLALLRLSRRIGSGVPATLSAILHEVRRLHEMGGLVAEFSADHYCAAFDRLLQAKLLEMQSAAEVGKLYAPCRGLADHLYTELVQDLQSVGKPSLNNPLRALPQPVQQWVTRQE